MRGRYRDALRDFLKRAGSFVSPTRCAKRRPGKRAIEAPMRSIFAHLGRCVGRFQCSLAHGRGIVVRRLPLLGVFDDKTDVDVNL